VTRLQWKFKSFGLSFCKTIDFIRFFYIAPEIIYMQIDRNIVIFC
jgi:hypothetical protein